MAARCARNGLGTNGPGVDLELRDVTVHASRCLEPECGSFGVAVMNGGMVRVTRATLVGGTEAAVVAGAEPDQDGADLALEDLLVLPDDGAVREHGGIGLFVAERTVARVRRAALLGLSDVGAWSGAREVDPAPGGGEIELTDVVVRGTRSRASGENGMGLAVTHGARMRAERVVLRENMHSGVAIEGEDSEVQLVDVAVLDSRTSPDGLRGHGVQGTGGPTVRLRRVLFEGNRTGALAVEGGRDTGFAEVHGEDVTIRDTTSGGAGRGGFGVVVQFGAEATLRRVAVADSQEAGVVVQGRATGAATSLVLEDVRITGTRPATCGLVAGDHPHACRADGRHTAGGHGLLVVQAAVARLDGFVVSGSDGIGVVAALGGELDLSRGAITGNGVGVSLLTPDLDPGRLEDRVFVFDNTTDWSQSQIHLPDPAADLGGVAGRVEKRKSGLFAMNPFESYEMGW